MNTKLIVNYLPQYHQIEENDEWWGKGYTDWVAVKGAKSLYEGHLQPNEPQHNNYYHLDDVSTIRWQVDLAIRNGIYGFGIYHYWFNERMCLLDKPVRLIRDNLDINIKYMFIWDNATWRRTWSAVKGPSNAWAPQYDGKNEYNGDGVLAELKYGEKEDWENHYKYLLQFFKDDRYIKINNKPVFCIFNPDNNMDVIKKMTAYWNERSKQDGFAGMMFIGKYKGRVSDFLEYRYYYQPEWSGWKNVSIINRGMDYIRRKQNKATKPVLYSYDVIWKKIIKNAENSDERCFNSGFVTYDDTPRRGTMGRVVADSSPTKFEYYFKKLYKIALEKKQEFVFITAWNEWGEGAYLEPDKRNESAFIEALGRVIHEYENKN